MDPVTFGAQILNFVVLLLLLRRFLYRPILRVMAERERRLEETRLQGEERLAEARRLAEAASEELRLLEERREDLLARAEAEVEERRQALLEEARQEVQERQARWQEGARRRREEALRDLRPRMARAVLAVCRRALEDLAGADLEDRMAYRLARRLREHPLAPAPATVTSGSPLSDSARRALEEALPREATVDFRTRPSGAPGLVVAVGEWQVDWTFDSHFEALHDRMEEVLEERDRDLAVVHTS